MRVFENRVTKKIFGPERVEITVEMDKPHNEALHNFYPSSNILLIIKQREIVWAGMWHEWGVEIMQGYSGNKFEVKGSL